MDYHSQKTYKLVYLFVVIFGTISVILVLVWTSKYLGGFAWQEDPLHEFNYHPVSAVMGLVVLYGNGLLLYRTLYRHPKSRLKTFHAIAMVTTFILSVISLKTVFDSHDKRVVPIPNLYSMHSWIGLGTVGLFACQLLLGFVIFLYPGGSAAYRKRYLHYHQFFGIAVFILSVLSSHSGIMEKVKANLGKEYQTLPPAAYIANFLGVTITIFALLVIYLATNPQFRRKPLPEEDKLSSELTDNL